MIKEKNNNNNTDSIVLMKDYVSARVSSTSTNNAINMSYKSIVVQSFKIF